MGLFGLFPSECAVAFGAVAYLAIVFNGATFRLTSSRVEESSVDITGLVISSIEVANARRATNGFETDDAYGRGGATRSTPSPHDVLRGLEAELDHDVFSRAPSVTTVSPPRPLLGSCAGQVCSCGHGRSGAYTPRVTTCSIEDVSDVDAPTEPDHSESGGCV
jgi:hypothetical protein